MRFLVFFGMILKYLYQTFAIPVNLCYNYTRGKKDRLRADVYRVCACSSVDRAPASGAGSVGSIPVRRTIFINQNCRVGSFFLPFSDSSPTGAESFSKPGLPPGSQRPLPYTSTRTFRGNKERPADLVSSDIRQALFIFSQWFLCRMSGEEGRGSCQP